ncbi:hypothetical protein [Caulobacter phage Cr30]|nr:hypothetical protein OZ74_gp145 [Caulobacter phage Cr30]AGS81030.1 hypothetical protein [Caulobacter phage Cr30]
MTTVQYSTQQVQVNFKMKTVSENKGFFVLQKKSSTNE